jgi:hypothetical protein
MVEFTLVLDPPDQMPASRFSLQIARVNKIIHFRHDRVLIHSPEEQH